MKKIKKIKKNKYKKESYNGIWVSESIGYFSGFADDSPEKRKRISEIENKLKKMK